MHDKIERRLHAEFGSLADQIANDLESPRLPEWLQLVAFEANPEGKKAVRDIAREDARNRRIWRRKGSSYLKMRVLENLNYDLGASATFNVDVSMDRYFLPLLLRKATTTPAPGQVSLTILFPNLAGLSWAEIADAREHAGVEAFRHQLSEIEHEAWQEVATGKDLKESILRRAVIDLAEGWRPPRGIEKAGKVGLDLVLGLHPVGGVASAAIDLREAEAKGAAWGACFLRMLELTAKVQSRYVARSPTTPSRRSVRL